MIRTWVTDTNVSLPGGPPPNKPVQINLGGFAFSTGGICHPLTQSDYQDLVSSLYTPIPLKDIASG